MPITEAQRRKRHCTLGASEVAAIMGMSPFATAKDIFNAKRFDLYGVSAEDYYAKAESETTEAQELGNALEDVVIEICARQLGVKVLKNVRRRRGLFTASIDAQIRQKPEHIEAKTTGRMHGDIFGEEGTDQLPNHILLQCQAQMYVTGNLKVHVPVLMPQRFGGLSIKRYVVEREESLIAAIVDKCTVFWKENVVKGIPPDGSEVAPLEMLKLRQPTVGKVVTAPSEPLVAAIVAWDRAKAVRKDLEAKMDAAEAILLEQLEDAECVMLPDGRTLTRSRQLRSTVSLDKLRKDYADVARICTVQSYTKPSLRLTKPKAEKNADAPKEIEAHE